MGEVIRFVPKDKGRPKHFRLGEVTPVAVPLRSRRRENKVQIAPPRKPVMRIAPNLNTEVRGMA
jgi:hypothetical protein